MDARMQKHRMMRWMGCLFVALTLVASTGVQAASKCKAWYMYGCSAPDRFTFTQNCLFPTELAATQAYYAKQNADYCRNDTVHCFVVVTSCDEVTRQCPYTQNGYSGFTGMPCWLWDTPKFTITLTGGTEVKPSNGSDIKTLPFIATVKDQSTGLPTTNPVEVSISLKVNPTSGGHDHGDSDRPRGGIAGVQTCASDDECWKNQTVNGEVVFNFNAPEASGTHTISATCDGCSNTATKPVNVKVDGLKPIPAVPLFYALNETNGDVIGAQTGWHTNNHNLTPAAAQKLMVIALLYRTLPQFKVVVDKKTGKKDFPPVLHINDASLPWGGVLDFDAEAEWNAPHKEHRRGTVVDIRANSKPGAIPNENFETFKRLAKLHKVHAKPHSEGQTNQHFHVRLLNRSE